MAIAGVSTLGIKLSYGIETVAGQKPAAFKLLNRINSIGGITIEPETIDASALEDLVERSVAGRGTTGGTFPVSINVTDNSTLPTKAEEVMSEVTRIMSGLGFEVSAMPIFENNVSGVHRMTARFRRLIGANEPI
jgi:hypothetical protein